MATTRIFIDDAVTGRLPDVCVKDGVPAGGSKVVMTTEIGRSNRLGILWLLLFLGPVGWVILLVLAARDHGERLTVKLPISEAAYQRQVAATRDRNLKVAPSFVAGLAVLVLAAVLGLDPVVWFAGVAVLAVGVVLSLVGEHRIEQTKVGLELDASRRWLTVTRVHPAFVEAVAEQEAAVEVRRT